MPTIAMWATSTIAAPDTSSQLAFSIERSFPGCIIVNQLGERFINEAARYSEIVYAIYADCIKAGTTGPYSLMFDATFYTKYPMSRLP